LDLIFIYRNYITKYVLFRAITFIYNNFLKCPRPRKTNYTNLHLTFLYFYLFIYLFIIISPTRIKNYLFLDNFSQIAKSICSSQWFFHKWPCNILERAITIGLSLLIVLEPVVIKYHCQFMASGVLLVHGFNRSDSYFAQKIHNMFIWNWIKINFISKLYSLKRSKTL
jgi:hypothetical protein